LPEQPPAGEDPNASLPDAEPLSPADAKDAAPIVAVYGEGAAACLYSKQWQLRQAGAQQMTAAMPTLDTDARALAQATCKAVGRCSHDKMVQVFLAGMGLFDALLRQPHAARVSPSEWQGLLFGGNGSIVDTFRTKLADGNARVRDAVEAAFVALSRLPAVGPHATVSALLVPIDPKKATDTRLWLGRLGVLQQLFSEFGEPHLREHIDGAMALVKRALESSSGAVRSKATELALEIYSLVGDLQLMAAHLADLKQPAIRDSLMAAFEQADQQPMGASGGAQQQPACIACGGGRAAGAASPPPGGPAQQFPPPPGDADGDEHTCQFCGRHDPTFDEEKLDLHFWKECPMLMPCEQCGQVVEVAALAEHLVTECDQSQPFKYQPPLGTTADYTGCPLCGEELPRDPVACRAHVMHECPGNKRCVPPP